MRNSQSFGTEPIGKLLRQQSIPASIGILMMSIYMIVDTIFVGRLVGNNGIGAITVVMPIAFLIASVGMAIGVGGSSIVSRSLGKDDEDHAQRVFSNMVTLTIGLALLFMLAGYLLMDEILLLFGANGDLMAPSREYFFILLPGIPFLAWGMMSNNVIRAEGSPQVAMLVMALPAVINIALDAVFMWWMGMGIEGAGLATSIAYFVSAMYATWFFFSSKSDLNLRNHGLCLDLPILKEIGAIGSVTLARQGAISVLTIVLNQTLFAYGQETAVNIWGILNRVLMFVFFPVLGITQGFIPIVGFNYGAERWDRVRKSINLSVKVSLLIGAGIMAVIMIFTEQFVSMFTADEMLIAQTVPTMRIVFAVIPLVSLNLIGSGYFQAIGKVYPALFLTLTRQAFFLIPLILIFPMFWGLQGVWYAFPAADLMAAVVTWLIMVWSIKKDFGTKLAPQS